MEFVETQVVIADNALMIQIRVDSLIPRVGFFARRKIEAGEELTFNNGSTCQQNMTGKYPCHCGSSNCIKFLPFNPAV